MTFFLLYQKFSDYSNISLSSSSEIIRLLNENESVKNISEKTGVSRMTIYNNKKRISI
ncbi:helix-turn-helix domain-containing protein [Peribacillus sp. NPDC060186]